MGAISLKYKSKNGNLTAPQDIDLGAMIPIATVTVVQVGQSISFQNIPNNYEHLQVRFLGKNSTGGIASLYTSFNNDSNQVYASHILRGDGSATYSLAYPNEYYNYAYQVMTGTTYFAAAIIDILDYSNTNKFKTLRYLCGYDANGSGVVGLASGLYRSTNAINRLDVFSTQSFDVGTTAALYGIKRAGA